MGALAQPRGEGTSQQTLGPFPRAHHRRQGGVAAPGRTAHSGRGVVGPSGPEGASGGRAGSSGRAPGPPRASPQSRAQPRRPGTRGPPRSLSSALAPASRRTFSLEHSPVSPARSARLGSALTCAPCDRLPSAISGVKVRPLLVSALDSRSSVPRLSVLHPPGRPTCSPRALPPASSSDPARGARRGRSTAPPGPGTAPSQAPRSRRETAAAQELQSRSASRGRAGTAAAHAA